jgi:hypothetical protein
MKKQIKRKYTVEEIVKIWDELYGENFKTEYKGIYLKLLRGK